MGGGLSMGARFDFTGSKIDVRDEVKDERRRNSLAFYISSYVEFEGEEYQALVTAVEKDRHAKTGGKAPVFKDTKYSVIADTILQGNYHELRNQLLVYFKNINKPYHDKHRENTILHMVCQEGYQIMAKFMFDPANRSEVDDNTLLISPRNNRNRTPLMLCFTPPSATFCGMKFGIDEDGNARSERPPELEGKSVSDWCKPGGPRSREAIVKLLLDNGADPNEADYHGFTPIHFSSIWGWTSTVKLLIQKGADINPLTLSGDTISSNDRI